MPLLWFFRLVQAEQYFTSNMKLTDYQWVNIGYTAQSLRRGTLSGKLHRLLGAVQDKTTAIREQFEAEFKESLEGAGNPEALSDEWMEINIAVSDTFKLSSTELDVPTFQMEWFDEVKMGASEYEFLSLLAHGNTKV